VENRCRFDNLNEVAVTAICAVAPTGTTMEQCLHALTTRVMEVMNYGIRQGAAGALAAAQLWCGACVGWSQGSRHGCPFVSERSLLSRCPLSAQGEGCLNIDRCMGHHSCNTLGVWLTLNCISFHKHAYHPSHQANVTETFICNILYYVCFILYSCE
jgi:hypothetical protein